MRQHTISVAFYGEFATFSDFFLRKSTFFSKNPIFEPFEKSYDFSRILRQICYNLMKKKFQTREQPMFAPFTRAQLENMGWKNAPIWEEDFASHIFNMAQINNAIF